MNAFRALDEMYNELNAAQERFENTLSMMSRDAAELSVRVPSPDRSVEVTVRGDCGLESVSIDPTAYRHHSADSLRTAVLSTYRRAVVELSRRQHRTVLSAVIPIEPERP